MSNPRDKYYTKIYETLVDYNDRNNAPFSNEKIQQATGKVIAEEEADERNINVDTYNVTMDTLFHSTVTNNTQGETANTILTSEITTQGTL